jgi:hypothetical protein
MARQHEGFRMWWNLFLSCHKHNCLAIRITKMSTVATSMPHYMTLVIAGNTMQEVF